MGGANKTSRDLGLITDDLVKAALTREVTSEEPWNYGWCVADYRRSEKAAVKHDAARSVRLSAEGVAAFERAMNRLFKVSEIRDRYEAEELWSIAIGMIGPLPISSAAPELTVEIDRRLKRLTAPPDSVLVVPLANLNPGATVIEAGPLLIGHPGDEWRERLKARAGEPEQPSDDRQPWWHKLKDESEEKDVVLMAHVGLAQSNRAFRDAEEALENLLALALVLELDLDARGLFSLRGDSHRPGIRGLTVDRRALQVSAESSPNLVRELGAEVLVSGLFRTSVQHHWYGEEPFPLHSLLEGDRLLDVQRVLIGRTSVSKRLRLAARWHAKAYWSSEVQDAVLALGIGFEALLSEENPSPGRVLGERFAFLQQLRSERAARYKLFTSEYYAARSSIAHGAKRTGIDGRFARDMAKDLRQTFLTIASITRAQSVESEESYARMFETLKWGG